MSGPRPALMLLLAAALALGGCSEDTPLEPGAHALSGRVRLVGYRTNGNGDSLGTRTVDDADGVPVALESGNAVLARAATVDGAYRFDGLAPGSYRVRATVVNRVTDLTDVVTIRFADVVMADTLKLVSEGDLGAGPNPIGAAVGFRYTVFARARTTLRILDLGMRPVRVLADSVVDPGPQATSWDGRDSTGALAPGAFYWAAFESGIDQRAQLLFR